MNFLGKIIIIGCGISGITLAERYANVLKEKVLILEKRNHIGGNCFDFENSDGILVPKYGPHFFHTNHGSVWSYVNKFTEWYPYEHRVLSYVDGQLVPIPVNINTVNKIFGVNILTETEMKMWLEKNRYKISNPKNSEESALRRVGKVLYEKMFMNYTKKQWDMYPYELDPSVMDRIPVRNNFDDRYFTDKYQAMPKHGYAKMFERMLDNDNIEVRLNTDYTKIKDELKGYSKLFFTGPIDQYFENKYGKLQYRSLQFEYETYQTEYFQKSTQINYPNDNDYTRITEPKHATGQKNAKTTIIKEYATWDGEPFYPIPNKQNQAIFEQYQKDTGMLEKEGVHFVGRLANYKYFNMDQAFENALELFKKTS
jgi:UDP-galactopyranose mutase